MTGLADLYVSCVNTFCSSCTMQSRDCNAWNTNSWISSNLLWACQHKVRIAPSKHLIFGQQPLKKKKSPFCLSVSPNFILNFSHHEESSGFIHIGVHSKTHIINHSALRSHTLTMHTYSVQSQYSMGPFIIILITQLSYQSTVVLRFSPSELKMWI